MSTVVCGHVEPGGEPRHAHDCPHCLDAMGAEAPHVVPCPCGKGGMVGQHIDCMLASGMSERRIRLWRIRACMPGRRLAAQFQAVDPALDAGPVAPAVMVTRTP